jgi:hypothetical protein
MIPAPRKEGTLEGEGVAVVRPGEDTLDVFEEGEGRFVAVLAVIEGQLSVFVVPPAVDFPILGKRKHVTPPANDFLNGRHGYLRRNRDGGDIAKP